MSNLRVPYEQVNLLDAPEIIAHRMATEGVLEGITDIPRAFFALNSMTINERQTYASQLKAQLPENPFAHTAVNVLTNPLIYMFLILEGVTRVNPFKIFKASALYSPIVREQGGLLKVLGINNLMGADHLLSGTSLPVAVGRIEEGIKAVNNRVAHRTIGEYSKLLNARKASSLADLKEDDLLIRAWLEGAGVRTKRPVLRGGKVTEAELTPIVSESLLEAEMTRRGLMPLAQSIRDSLDDVRDFVFGDPENIAAIWRGIRQGSLGKKDMMSDHATQMIGTMVGQDALETVVTTAKSGDLVTFRDLVKKLFSAQHYMPRNTTRWYRKTGGFLREMTPEDIQREMTLKRLGPGVAATASSVPRITPRGVFDDADLRILDDLGLVGGEQRETFERVVKRALDQKEKLEEGGVLRLHKFETDRSFTKYVQESARTYALYVQDVGDDILHAQSTYRNVVQESMHRNPDDWKLLNNPEALKAAGFVDVKTGTPIPLDEVFDVGRTPIGGWKVFDAIRRDVAMLRDDHARNFTTELLLPTATGTIRPSEGRLASTTIALRQYLGNLMDTGIGDTMRRSGMGGLVDDIQKWSQKDITGLSISHGIADYLYGTTLGMNFGSVAINSTQPLFATRFLPIESVIAGYAEGFKDIAKYAALRSQLGNRALTGQESREQLQQLISQSFRNHELFEITPSLGPIMEQIGPAAYRAQRSSAFKKGHEFLLKPFHLSELFNRSVTGHATLHALRKAGHSVDIDDPAVKELVTRTINETQFAPALRSTPAAFLNQSGAREFKVRAPFGIELPLENRLARQFLTFPTRTATSVFLTSNRLSGRDPSPFSFFNENLARTVMMSALFYEVGKGLGFDTVEATPLGAGLGAVQSFGPLAPFPAPPIVGISIGAAKWAFTQDAEDIGRVLTTLVPGGLALSKAFGVAPATTGTPLNVLNKVRRTQADYQNRTEDGMVPLLDQEGRVITYANPLELSLRFFGFDRLGQYRDENALSRALLKDRETYLNIRRKYMHALYLGRVDKAKALANSFKRKFGFELSVTRSQLREYIRGKSRTRPERVLNTLPPELRSQLTPAVSGQLGERLGFSPDTFDQFNSASQRDPLRGINIDEEVRRLMAEERQARPPAFQPFGSF